VVKFGLFALFELSLLSLENANALFGFSQGSSEILVELPLLDFVLPLSWTRKVN